MSHLLFDTLIRLDCQRRPRPGLAAAWSKDSTGTVWTFVLRDDALDAGGSPLSAQDAVRIWHVAQSIQRSVTLRSAVALDDKRIAFTLSSPQDSVPEVFADPSLSLHSHLTPRTPALIFRRPPSGDPRDALDRGADLLVTRDPALVDYAAAKSEFVSLPLPWTTTYVLIEPAARENGLVPGGKLGALRQSLARDAVRADARAAEPPFWWDDLERCPAPPAPLVGPRSSRVVYPVGDEVARALAERIVALAGAGAGLTTRSLADDELRAALRSDSERAYLLAVPRQSLTVCRDSAEWLLGASAVPLIDTRAHAIVRRGAPPLTIEWDGTPRPDDSAAKTSSP